MLARLANSDMRNRDVTISISVFMQTFLYTRSYEEYELHDLFNEPKFLRTGWHLIDIVKLCVRLIGIFRMKKIHGIELIMEFYSGLCSD